MATTIRETLRIIDANFNRIGEGLRCLEDAARLILNDAVLTEQLKAIRHQVLDRDLSFNQKLLESRDSEGDIGINTESPRERELPIVLVANSRRIQESLRAVEELSKLPDIKLDPDIFKKARFGIYTIEQKLISKIMRQDKIKRLTGLYVIIDTLALKRRNPTEVASQAIRGGARIIQLRDKTLSKKELLPVAEQLKTLCDKHDTLFIVNDYLDLALAVDADGLHLGQGDLPVKTARKLLSIDQIVGCSARTVEKAVAAQSDGADYIATGSIYPTSSKENPEIIGIERLCQIRQAITIPLVAIGGITKENASEVIDAGANTMAVISAVLDTTDPEKAAREMVVKIEQKRK